MPQSPRKEGLYSGPYNIGRSRVIHVGSTGHHEAVKRSRVPLELIADAMGIQPLLEYRHIVSRCVLVIVRDAKIKLSLHVIECEVRSGLIREPSGVKKGPPSYPGTYVRRF